jgi:hypothetical protein
MAEPKTVDEIMEGRFIKRVLQDTSKDIDQVQVKYMTTHGFENPDWYSARSFNATESALEFAQKIKGRFVDMKKIMKGRGENKKQQRKKNHPIYNKVMYGHYNNVVRELKFGYTDAIKEEMRKLED